MRAFFRHHLVDYRKTLSRPHQQPTPWAQWAWTPMTAGRRRASAVGRGRRLARGVRAAAARSFRKKASTHAVLLSSHCLRRRGCQHERDRHRAPSREQRRVEHRGDHFTSMTTIHRLKFQCRDDGARMKMNPAVADAAATIARLQAPSARPQMHARRAPPRCGVFRSVDLGEVALRPYPT